MSSFQLDVIATSALGIHLNSLEDPENPFVQNAKAIGAQSFNSPFMILSFVFPFIFKLVPVLPKKPIDFFAKSIHDIVETRKSGRAPKRGDMLDLLIEAEKESEFFTEEIMVSSAILFFLAGNETVVSTITSIAYVLALHQDIQQRVYEEVRDKVENYSQDRKITSETIAECRYLEQVVQETLRFLTPFARFERCANREYNLNGVTIPKGGFIHVSIASIHQDPDYYEDPDTFNPDRFSRENKASIHPLAYLPFSAGPRNCVGMRLALDMVMFAVMRLLLKFRFHKGTYNKYPMKPSPGFIVCLQDFRVAVENRKKV